jgi:Neurotransmitter-gated ion-channel ligand binding domain
VNVTLYIINYHACSVKKQVELQMYFRQSWKDERLANDEGVTIINSQLADDIWVPDTFFSSAKKTEFIDQPTPNQFVRISPDGTVLLSKRYNLVLPCFAFNLGMSCNLDIESCKY